MSYFSINTKVFVGIKSLFQISNIPIKKCLVVCDPFIVSSGMLNDLVDILNKTDVQHLVFSDVVPDTPFDIISKGVKLIYEFEPDSIIAFGGGSAIDTAKAISIIFCKATSVSKPTFIAIPTTSGTGSEVTGFSVVYDAEKKVKYPLVDDSMLPDYAILDSRMVKSVPLKVTVDTGVDVLTHALEAYVSVHADDFTDAFSEKAIRLVFDYLPIVYKDLNDMEARQKMHNASCIAGMAFNLSNLGLNHSMAHALGAQFGVPHGRSNALFLPYVIYFNANLSDIKIKNDKVALRYSKLAKIMNITESNNSNGAKDLFKYIVKFLHSLGIEKSISCLGVNEDEFLDSLNDMVESALKDACLEANPRKCTKEDIKKVFLNAYYGKFN